MTKAVASSFLDLVRRSNLVEGDRLDKFLAELKVRGGGKLPEEQEKLAEELIKADLLTEWQAEKLLAGKHKGFILGKYKLLRQLGKGGMSTVYLAEHMMMKRKVAIKVLPQSRVEDSTYLERFRIEARAAAKLDDPNIVRAYDIDQDGKTHYLVMEYVPGQDLHLLVKEQGPLDYNTAVDYIAQAASGLAHAHKMGLVHRDIKPANCLLDENKTVKLLDMGLARLVDDEASLTLDNNENVLGTADYLAPEQALNSHKADTRADIYSLGCTLYYLLTGHPPFPEGTISERLLKHQVESAPSIFKDRPDAPPILVNICDRMMAKKVEDRYQTAEEVVERLREYLADRGLEPGSSGKSSDASGGVGSDVFRRFAASMKRPGESGSAVNLDGSGKADGGSTKPRKPDEPEEEIGLAPIDEEGEKEEQRKKPNKPKPTPAAKPDSESDKAAPEPAPLRSLIEEELDALPASETAPVAKGGLQPGEIDPLRPPGFTGPNYGPPTWVYIAIGGSVLALLALVIFLFFAL